MQPNRFILETRDTYGRHANKWRVMEGFTEDYDMAEAIRVARRICDCDDINIRITKLDGELGTFRDVTEYWLSEVAA